MSINNKVKIHTAAEFEAMRKAGRVVAEVLDEITLHVKPGVTTSYLNDQCHRLIEERGAKPAALGYRGFPKSICTSVNHVVCHGIPSDHKLENGDTLNIDAAVIFEGWYGDSGRMYWVGDKILPKAKRLTQVTYDAMMLGIEQIKPGAKLSSIGKAIQQHVEKHDYSVVRDFCGHGLGQVFHDAPNVLHYYDPEYDMILEEGMFFTVEPMVNAGAYGVKVLADGWTAVTKDRSLSAQFEHAVGVTSAGYEIFTTSPSGRHFPPYIIE